MIEPETSELICAPGSSFRRLATAAAFASLLAYAMALFAIPACLNKIRDAYGVTEGPLGLFQPAMMAGFFAAVLVAGSVSDKRGKLPTIGIGCILLALGLFAFVWTRNFNVLIAAAFLLGMGGGASEATSMALIADLYAASGRTAMANLSQTVFGVGAVATPLLVGLLLKQNFPWQAIFCIIGVLGLISCVPAFIATAMRGEKTACPHEEMTGWRSIASNHLIIWLAVGIALYVGAELGQSYWLARYLRVDLHATEAMAASSLSYMWFGIIIGRLAGTWLSGRLTEMQMIIGALIFATLSQLAVLASTGPVFAACAAVALGACLGPIYPTIVSRAVSVFPTRSGTVTSIIAAAGAAGGAIFPPAVGFVVDAAHVGLRVALGLISLILILNVTLFTRLRAVERRAKL